MNLLNYCKSIRDTAFLVHGKGTVNEAILNQEALSRIEFVIASSRLGSQEAVDLIELAGDLSMKGVPVKSMIDRLNLMQKGCEDVKVMDFEELAQELGI